MSLAGFGGAVQSWRNARAKLVKNRQKVWSCLLRKLSRCSSDAMWLLENPLKLDELYPPQSLFSSGRSELLREHISRMRALLEMSSSKMTDEELLILNEAFPFHLELILKDRRISPDLLIQYNIHNKITSYGELYRKMGLFEIQPHLKKLPLKDQIPFFGIERDKYAALLVVRFGKLGNPEFYFRVLEQTTCAEFRYITTRCLEAEFVLHGLSFTNFVIKDKNLCRILDLLKEDKEDVIWGLISLSKKQGQITTKVFERIFAEKSLQNAYEC